jgi:RpiR family glv operon transcriptional regulator
MDTEWSAEMSDFYEVTRNTVADLNQTEQKLFDYVVKNMDSVKTMSIHKLASECYLSSTTVFRFTRKLGFLGYSDFIRCLLVTSHQVRSDSVPAVLHKKTYSEDYLKNITEAVRMLAPEKIDLVRAHLRRKPRVYLITDNHTHDIGRYCERLFFGLGLITYFPEVKYQETVMLAQVTSEDMLVCLSFSGEDQNTLETIERIYLTARPFLLSLTRADNNTLQNISDVNFYIFADELKQNDLDLTSRVSMIMILELIVFGEVGR